MKAQLTLLATLIVLVSANAQQTTTNLLQDYLKIKDALVQSDGKSAARYGADLVARLSTEKDFTQKGPMLKLAQTIRENTDIEKQRTAFAALSPKVWSLVKKDKEIQQELYYQYCPMKQGYWISAEKAIQNPYYGSKMLTCGNTAEKNK